MAALTPLQSLVACGTKLWLDSVDPQAVKANRAYGATGATSNPIIIADLIKTGRFDDMLTQSIRDGMDDTALAWHMTDHLVKEAQAVFLPVWQETRGDNGYVSFELDPLLEDVSCKLSQPERTTRYVELGKEWSKGHKNRMIKVPATPAGLGALEELAAHGVTLNVTLIFGADQYTTELVVDDFISLDHRDSSEDAPKATGRAADGKPAGEKASAAKAREAAH